MRKPLEKIKLIFINYVVEELLYSKTEHYALKGKDILLIFSNM